MIKDRWSYEQLLNSLYITFDDFQADYAEALKASSYNDTRIQEYNYLNYPKNNPDASIPPIIHFIWFRDLYETSDNTSNIPLMGSHAPASCQLFNPDFTINIWNSSTARSLLEEHYDWFIETYDSYTHPIQRVDAIKYFVLHHYGGVSLQSTKQPSQWQT